MNKQYLFAGSIGSSQGSQKGSLSGNGEGIYTLSFENNKLKKESVISSEQAGIICLNEKKTVLYAANEVKDFGGLNGSGGGVSAYRIQTDGTLTLINSSLSYGSRTSYVTVSTNQQYLLATNHGSHTTVTCHYVQDAQGNWVLQRGFDDSSLAVFKIREDGGIGDLCDLMVFDGHGYWCHGGGQSTSHLHCVKERNGLIFACNRGADEIEVLRLAENGKLQLLNRHHTKPALAPRHMVFHPHKNIIYVVNENYPCVSTYQYHETTGQLIELQTIETLPKDYYIEHPLPSFNKPEADPNEINTSGMSDFTLAMPSDIHITSNGQYLYVTNRRLKGTGSITTFRINEDHTLCYLETHALPGGDPRGFNLLNDTHLIIGLSDTNLVQVYVINPDTGMLTRLCCEERINSTASFTTLID